VTGILVFESDFGPVFVEVDEAVAKSARGQASTTGQGVQPLSFGGSDIVARAEKSFSEAMQTLRAYVANLQEVIGKLDVAPKEVSVEVGLKLEGSAGFIIARAGAETSMKITLKWEPGALEKPRVGSAVMPESET
jgi:hypothetical protein